MKKESMLGAAGNAFKCSKFKDDELLRSCFIESFMTGIRFYANHLYKKGSLFDILKSIRSTNDADEWSPIENYEKTIIKILGEYRAKYLDIIHLKNIIKEKEERIKELENALSTIH